MLYDRHAEEIIMDAAHTLRKTTPISYLIALTLVLAAPAWSQSLTVSSSTVTLNQSTTSQIVNVSSSDAPPFVSVRVFPCAEQEPVRYP